MQLSQRVLNLPESATLKMARLSSELKASGKDVISMSLGEPDFDTPSFICEAATQAMKDGKTHYTPVPGTPELRKAIVNKLKRDNNVEATLDQIVVSTGAKQTIANLAQALVDEGSQVVLPTPYWVSYRDIVEFNGGEVTEIKTSVEDDFKVTPEKLENALSSMTRMYIFSNPCNPSGSVYTREELSELVKVFVKFPQCIIVSDEIYELINFEESSCSLGEFPEIKDQLVIVNGVSKGFAMTGWRIGYMMAPPELAKACSKIQSQSTSGANSIAQAATISALEVNPSENKDIQNMKETFHKRRDLIVGELRKIEGLKVNVPTGAFYIFPDISAFLNSKTPAGEKILNSTDLCMYLLDNHLIGVTPGDAFGNPANIRMSYATDDESIIKACNRLAEGLKALTPL